MREEKETNGCHRQRRNDEDGDNQPGRKKDMVGRMEEEEEEEKEEKEEKEEIPQSFVSHKAPCHSLFWDKEIFCFSILFSPSSQRKREKKRCIAFSLFPNPIPNCLYENTHPGRIKPPRSQSLRENRMVDWIRRID